MDLFLWFLNLTIHLIYIYIYMYKDANINISICSCCCWIYLFTCAVILSLAFVGFFAQLSLEEPTRTLLHLIETYTNNMASISMDPSSTCPSSASHPLDILHFITMLDKEIWHLLYVPFPFTLQYCFFT